jgi:hypothetical protein
MINKNAISEMTARVVFFLAIVAAGALLAAAMSGCRTTRIVTETVTKTDTVTVKRDSIIIHDRIDTVEIELPQSVMYVEIPISNDTISELSDKYYTSTAAVLDGRLRHTLRSNPGATLTGAALVHDTVKVYVDSTMINNQSQHSEIKEVPVNHLHWWQKALMWVGVIAIIGGGFTLYNYIKRK